MGDRFVAELIDNTVKQRLLEEGAVEGIPEKVVTGALNSLTGGNSGDTAAVQGALNEPLEPQAQPIFEPLPIQFLPFVASTDYGRNTSDILGEQMFVDMPVRRSPLQMASIFAGEE